MWRKDIGEGVPRPVFGPCRGQARGTARGRAVAPVLTYSCTPQTRALFGARSMPKASLFTSESVSMGHPDKVADQISDAVLDAMIADDPFSRVACETMCCTGLVVVAGEV